MVILESIVGGILLKKTVLATGCKAGAAAVKAHAAHAGMAKAAHIAHSAHAIHTFAEHSAELASWWTAHAKLVAEITGGVAVGALGTKLVEDLVKKVDSGDVTETEARSTFFELVLLSLYPLWSLLCLSLFSPFSGRMLFGV
jgi:hypothetical protein